MIDDNKLWEIRHCADVIGLHGHTEALFVACAASLLAEQKDGMAAGRRTVRVWLEETSARVDLASSALDPTSKWPRMLCDCAEAVARGWDEEVRS
jgi:hypothetical protein